jgi:hypothetical protein
MKCEAAQDWLLQCESLQPKSWPRGVVKHLRVCTACYQFAKGVKRLEKAWRNQPVPEESEAAKTNFLAKLSEMERAEKPKPKRDRRAKQPQSARRRPPWGMIGLGIAASIFIGIIGVGWLLPGRNANKNTPFDVEDLVAWNVEMVNADREERKRIYEEYEPSFRTDLKRAVLSPEDRQLADYLLDSGRQLAYADGPMAEAQVVTEIADKLFKQAAVAVDNGNETESERCGMRYSRFNAYAVKPMWIRFNPPEKKAGGEKDKSGSDKGFDKDKGGDKGFPKGFDKGDQKKLFEMLYKKSPEFALPDLHNKFDAWGKKGGPGFGPGFGPKGGKR